MGLFHRDYASEANAGPCSPDVESSSDAYAKRFSGPVGDWFLSVQEHATLRMLAEYPHVRVLDVGGAHGQIAPALLRHGYHVTVLGSHESSQAHIQGLLKTGRCEFRAGNLLALPFPDREFPVVIAYRLLSHVPNWKQFISELTRVAGQAVIIDYASKRSLNAAAPLLFGIKRYLEGDTRPFQRFSQSELANEVRPYGFIPRDRVAQYFFPMAMHRLLGMPHLSSCLEQLARRAGLSERFGSPVILKFIRSTR